MFPLDSLLHRLESAGFHISPADRLRVVQLLDTMGRACLQNPKQLRLLLAPVLARSAAEQAKFYEVFDQWLPIFILPEKPSVRFRWKWVIAASLIIIAASVAWYFMRPAPTPLVPKNDVALTDTARVSEKPVVLPPEKIANVLKPRLTVRELHLAKEQETPRPGWVAWSLLTLMMLGTNALWWKWRRRAAARELAPPILTSKTRPVFGEIADNPPYTIPFRSQEAIIRTGREQYRLADAMRLRQQGEHPFMDVPASVQATVDRGGFPTLRFRMRRQPADYLCIIEEKHRQSHLSRLFQFYTKHIRGQDVALEVFHASNTLDRFWNAQYPGGLTLDQLQRLYPAHRLLVFGNAHTLLDVTVSGSARVRPDMAAAFRRWRQRLLITPNAPATWTFEEKALYDLFVIFPASLHGLSDAAQHIETSIGASADDDVPPTFGRWRERAQQRDTDRHDHRYMTWRDAADHEQYLAGRPDLLRWLRALAVYPTPTWEMTLAIGQSLEKQGIVVRPDDLLVLSRIDWLQTGRMPAGLREELLADLPHDTETAARQAAITALETARAEAGQGYAGIELGVNVAIQEFALKPKDPEKQETLRLMFEAGRVNKTQEQVADAALNRYFQQRDALEKDGSGENNLKTRDFLKNAADEDAKSPSPKRSVFSNNFKNAVALTLIMGPLTVWFAYLDFGMSQHSRTVEYLRSQKGKNWAIRHFFSWQTEPDSATIWNNRGVRYWTEQRDTTKALLYFGKASNSYVSGTGNNKLANDTLARGLGYRNAGCLWYNLAAEAFNTQLEALPLPPVDTGRYTGKPERYFGTGYSIALIDSVASRFQSLASTDIPALRHDAYQALGLSYLYRFSRDSAEAYYRRLLQEDNGYFKNLRSPRPNLETLLGILYNRIVWVDTIARNDERFKGMIYFQIKTEQQDLSVKLVVEALDKTGNVLAQTSLSPGKTIRGLNKASFTLPDDAKTGAFISDSLRITLLAPQQKRRTLDVWHEARHIEWKANSGSGLDTTKAMAPIAGVVSDLLGNAKTRPALNGSGKYGIREIKGVVLHWTANEASAKQNRDYLEKGINFASVHYLVDDQSVVQCIPDNEIAYHVGNARYTAKARELVGNSGLGPNYFTLGVDMCDSDKGIHNWTETYSNTVRFVRSLLQKHHLTINELYRHSDLVEGEDCPKKFLDQKVWEQFKMDVKGTSGKNVAPSGNSLGMLPAFPWPPPQFSGQYNIEPYFTNALILEDIETRLGNALMACGYDRNAYFRVPNGFALVTQVEQFNDDGSIISDGTRWSDIPANKILNAKDYIASLLTARQSNFRMFVFVVTDSPYSIGSDKFTEKEAHQLAYMGTLGLPAAIGQQRIILPSRDGKDKKNPPDSGKGAYFIDALVYEFTGSVSTKAVSFRQIGIMDAQTHLEKSGLLNALRQQKELRQQEEYLFMKK